MSTQKYDVVIVGAGPAGTCAALRLLQWGYRVALVEQSTFPRSQIGESLSPGIQNIFQYLGAESLLQRSVYIKGLGARVKWETKTPHWISAEQRMGGVMVDRSLLDADLLAMAKAQGATVYQPAKVQACIYTEPHWQLKIQEEGQRLVLESQFVLNAKGRSGNLTDKLITASETVAIWAEVPSHTMAQETSIEALPKGWLWGSPLPNGNFRAMAFVERYRLKQATAPVVLQQMLLEATLFAPLAKANSKLSKPKVCLVQAYAHRQPWQNALIQLGESAFTLDPLSSTGVEKAMRFSLQTAISLHTVLSGGNPQLAQDFYEEKLTESVATHHHWTANYYAQAWCNHDEAEFWQARATTFQLAEQASCLSAFEQRLCQALERAPKPPQNPSESQGIAIDQTLGRLWGEAVQLSSELKFCPTGCVVGETIEQRMSVEHPSLQGKTVFIEQVEIAPLLQLAAQVRTYGELVQVWSNYMPTHLAKKIVVVLWSLRVLKS